MYRAFGDAYFPERSPTAPISFPLQSLRGTAVAPGVSAPSVLVKSRLLTGRRVAHLHANRSQLLAKRIRGSEVERGAGRSTALEKFSGAFWQWCRKRDRRVER